MSARRDDDTTEPSIGQERPALFRLFGERVQATRVQVGFSRGDLAARCGVMTGTIEKVERGHPEPRVWLILTLCRGLRVQPNQLLGGLLDQTEGRGDSSSV